MRNHIASFKALPHTIVVYLQSIIHARNTGQFNLICNLPSFPPLFFFLAEVSHVICICIKLGGDYCWVGLGFFG